MGDLKIAVMEIWGAPGDKWWLLRAGRALSEGQAGSCPEDHIHVRFRGVGGGGDNEVEQDGATGGTPGGDGGMSQTLERMMEMMRLQGEQLQIVAASTSGLRGLGEEWVAEDMDGVEGGAGTVSPRWHKLCSHHVHMWATRIRVCKKASNILAMFDFFHYLPTWYPGWHVFCPKVMRGNVAIVISSLLGRPTRWPALGSQFGHTRAPSWYGFCSYYELVVWGPPRRHPPTHGCPRGNGLSSHLVHIWVPMRARVVSLF